MPAEEREESIGVLLASVLRGTHEMVCIGFLGRFSATLGLRQFFAIACGGRDGLNLQRVIGDKVPCSESGSFDHVSHGLPLARAANTWLFSHELRQYMSPKGVWPWKKVYVMYICIDMYIYKYIYATCIYRY